MVRHAKEPGEYYGFKVPLDAEYKIGRSWAGEPVDGDSKPAAEPITPATADAGEHNPPMTPKAAISPAMMMAMSMTLAMTATTVMKSITCPALPSAQPGRHLMIYHQIPFP